MNKNTKQNNTQKKFQTTVQKYLEKDVKTLESLGIGKRLTIHFGGRKKVPLLSRLAMKIIQRQGGVIDTQFIKLK